METLRITHDIGPEPDDDARQHLPAGTVLVNRYLVDSVSGVGGMGAVYKARDLHFPSVSKLVAVKEMVNRAADPVARNTIVRNFEHEANLLASLNHRAIPKIYDYFTIGDRSYLVMEFIIGTDLEQIVNQNQEFTSEARVIRWAIELCEVLEYLHTHQPDPIIFRDIKPSNVMINQHDNAVLIDFGIARQFNAGKKGTMIGTEGYSPPEQYRGEATPIADIYSLGATLHHILTRKDPRQEPPFSFNERPIRSINSDTSPILEQIIAKTLQYNPAERYQSIQEVKEVLINAAKETGVLTKIPSSTPAIQRSNEAKKPIWKYSCQDEIRGSAKYRNGVVYFGCYDHFLYALEATTGACLWKYAADGGIVSKPAFFEDNILIGSEDHRLHSILERSGRVNWTYYSDGPIRSSPAVAEGHIFIGSDDGYLHVVNAQTGRQAWRAEAGAPVRCSPQIRKDRIYFGSEAGDFFCLDLSGGIMWRYKAKRAITASPIIHQDIVYFSSVDSTLYALDANTGWVIWRVRLGKPSISTPSIYNEQLYLGAVDGIIYCLEPGTGREIWRYATQNQVTGSPVVHGSSVYCGSVDGHIYCLDTRTGKMIWKYKTKGAITGTPEIFEDKIFIGSTDHSFYALEA